MTREQRNREILGHGKHPGENVPAHYKPLFLSTKTDFGTAAMSIEPDMELAEIWNNAKTLEGIFAGMNYGGVKKNFNRASRNGQ